MRTKQIKAWGVVMLDGLMLGEIKNRRKDINIGFGAGIKNKNNRLFKIVKLSITICKQPKKR
jgi:hypothetical protein